MPYAVLYCRDALIWIIGLTRASRKANQIRSYSVSDMYMYPCGWNQTGSKDAPITDTARYQRRTTAGRWSRRRCWWRAAAATGTASPRCPNDEATDPGTSLGPLALMLRRPAPVFRYLDGRMAAPIAPDCESDHDHASRSAWRSALASSSVGRHRHPGLAACSG